MITLKDILDFLLNPFGLSTYHSDLPKLMLSNRAVVRNSKGEYLLIQRAVKGFSYPGLWEFPGGKLDKNETVRESLLREVEEEDNETICKELEISATNAWVMLYRSRMGLRKCVEMHWAEKTVRD